MKRSPFARLEQLLVRYLGPADVGRSTPQAHAAAPVAGERLAGGWVRRGTPGNYYVVREEGTDPTDVT